MDINKIISIVRNLREEMVTGSSPGSAGFSGSASSQGPVAGIDPLMGLPKGNTKKYLYAGKGSRKMWMPKNV